MKPLLSASAVKVLGDVHGSTGEQAMAVYWPSPRGCNAARTWNRLSRPPGARLFRLPRSVGILVHAQEETQSDLRNKGPIPQERLWRYDGPARREVPDAD